MLKISNNNRFIVECTGRPFFYLADTAWELFHRLDREESNFYLANRAAKGFNAIQAVALAELNGLNAPNRYGDCPLLENDPTQPNEKYWQHVDYVVHKANELGMYITMLPTWGDKYNKLWGIGPEVFTSKNARVYGQWIAQRYAKCDIIWMLGGDRPLLPKHLSIIRAMAEGIRSSVGDTQLFTFHPHGGEASSTYVGAEGWLDFNTIQSGHVRDCENYRSIAVDYRRLPLRPVIDAEPGYENHPNSFNPEKGWLDHHDIRRSLYWSVFAGACGYTYGCNDIWQMRTNRFPPVGWARSNWKDSLDLPGAGQVQHCRAMMEARPYLTRIPDVAEFGRTSVVLSDLGTGADRICSTRDSESTYAMVYIPSGQRVTIDMTCVAGPKVAASWFNPRSGESHSIGLFDPIGRMEFDPPATDHTGRDWVLTIDAPTIG